MHSWSHAGDLILLNGKWYVTHSGLLGLARRKRCAGIHVRPAGPFCDPSAGRWAFKATVYKSPNCRGFVGYGDADPSNVSPLGPRRRDARGRDPGGQSGPAQGLRHRHLLGRGNRIVRRTSSAPRGVEEAPATAGQWKERKYGGPKVRDRLCQLIRQHQLDANLVKSYAVDFCGTKTLREASREQVEAFVAHLADWAEKDRNALLCQLNSYPRKKEGAA